MVGQIFGTSLTLSDTKGLALEQFDIVTRIKDLVDLILCNAKKKNHFRSAPGLNHRTNRSEMKHVAQPGEKQLRDHARTRHSCNQASRKKVEAGQYCSIALCDAGCRIDATALREFFSVFLPKHSGGRNTGLGLAICHDIVTKFCGTMWRLLICRNATGGQITNSPTPWAVS